MDPLSVTASFLGTLEIAWAIFKIILIEYTDYGFVRALLLNTIVFQAKPIIERINKHVVYSPSPSIGAATIRDSYNGSFDMIAVAAAIVAQIAISALSLDHLEEIHWTATASFVSSLACGCLSVYFSCLLNLQLGSLHSDTDVVNWLVTKKRFMPSGNRSEVLLPVASFYAAVLLAIPTQLLNWSLSFFLVGITIYYGQVFSNGLGTLPGGPNSNLAVLLFYTIITAIAGLAYFLPLWGKALEKREAEKVDNQDTIQVPLENFNSEEPGDLLRAVQTSLSAQERSLRTMQELVRTIANRERTG